MKIKVTFIYYILPIVTILLIVVSCGYNKRGFEEIVSSSIKLPFDKMLLLSDDSIWLDEAEHIQIVTIDSIQCASCLSNKLVSWGLFEKEARVICPNYRFCLIVSGNGESEKILERVKYYSKFFPVTYLDSTNIFRECNPIIRESPLLNSFIVGSDGTIKIIGDPTRSRKIEEIVFNYLDSACIH